jgi:hypothetical protein
MSLLDLFSSFLQPIFDLVPRIARRPTSYEWMIVDSWLAGVRLRDKPRLHCPALTHIEYLPACEIPIDCGIQRITTADGVSVIVNATCRIIIEDPILCREKVAEEWEEASAMIARSHVCDIISGHNWSHLPDLCIDKVGSEGMTEDLLHMGITLAVFKVEDLQKVTAIGVV